MRFPGLMIATLAVIIHAPQAAGDPFQCTTSLDPEISPDWSPDGSRIAFARLDAFYYDDIWTISPSGTAAEQITTHWNADGSPTWSPDGSEIAFSSLRSDNAQIWVVAVDGGSPVQITSDQGYHYNPAWSPDGTRIAYQWAQAGIDDIWIIDAPVPIEPVTWGRIKRHFH